MWGWIKDRASDIWGAVTGVFDFLTTFPRWLIARLMKIPDFFLTLLGWMPERAMRVQVKILIDPKTRRPVATRREVEREMRLAKRIFKELVNVKIIDPSGGNRFLVTGHGEIPPEFAMDPGCNLRGYGQKFTPVGRWFRRRVARNPVGTISGVGSPATIFAVRAGDGSGCFLGWGNYGYMNQSRHRTTLAHELGHACDLLHIGAGGTLMDSDRNTRRLRLYRLQQAILRSHPRLTKTGWF